MKKIVLSAIATYMFGASYTFLPYFASINYSNSNKDSGLVTGAYMSIFDSPFKTEMDVESTQITYNDNTPDLSQGDFTLFVNYYEGYNLAYKAGIHYISSTDELTDTGKIFGFGVLYYEMYKYNYGLDVYYSYYNNTSSSPKVIQFTPKGGINFSNDYYSYLGTFYLSANIDYIKILQNAPGKKTYYSNQFSLTNYNGNLTTTFGFWTGKRAYGVENGGFIVNNLSEVQTGGVNFKIGYKVDKLSSINVGYTYTKYDDSSTSKTYLLTYSYSF